MTQDRINAIGQTFKQRREEMNLSLKEVENATSIRSSYLHAIEQGQFDKLISSVYAQGFLKQYASFLGIDGDRIIEENRDIFTNVKHQEFSFGIGTIEARDNPGSGAKWLPNILWGTAFVFLFLFAWYLAKFLDVI